MISDMKRYLLILGSGGHGRVVRDAAEASGWEMRGFIDDTKPPGTRIAGCPVIGPAALLDDPAFLAGSAVIVALGDQAARRALSLRILERGGRLALVRHPAAILSPSAEVGAGTFLAPGAIVAAGTWIGRFCIINNGCSVDHDNSLADGVQVCPGAHLAGRVTCGEDVFIGTGAAVVPGVTIGPKAIVGAGAVVIADVPARATVVGNPARRAGQSRG
jgi:sugar O-acyltransferase (sialic acid O-acetyltransferase NeuD family)